MRQLEEAVQSQWKTPINVINQDTERKIVYYLDKDQHVVGIYKYDNGNYIYDNEQSEGMQFSFEEGIPFYVYYKHFEEAGNIVYGAITSDDNEVDKFIISYKNGEKQTISAKNNTFIAPIPISIDPDNFMSKIKAADAFDSEGNVIVSW
ncbi:hypothetical protein [Ornithinibacillus scapharcae]|uniref:hypothetical protein n=1 Tax=Ornithinibacillus scapharcae TaxID=1147159 RepID=UPI000225B08A|nr:hypothetical protein [Ornithinibacillus scapharcae]